MSASYEDQLRELAKSIGSDGCTAALQVHQVCCWEHDWCYVTGMTPRGRLISKVEADARFRECLQARSPFRGYSPLAWWRWVAVTWFGRGVWPPAPEPILRPAHFFTVVTVAGQERTLAALAEARARREDIFNEGPSRRRRSLLPQDGVTPPLLEQLQAETKRKTAMLPPEKTQAAVVAVDWAAGVPYRFRFGYAHRIGDHFELGAEALTKFTKASTSASVHVMWSK